MCFTETWLKKGDRNEDFFPTNFDIHRKDRNSIGGGVAVIIDKQFESTELSEYNVPTCESICVRILLKPKPLVLYLAYVEPKSGIDTYTRHFDLINRLVNHNHNHNILVIGDWNLPKITWKHDETQSHYLPANLITHRDSTYFQMAAEFLSKMQAISLFQLSNIKNIAGNVLDLVFVNDAMQYTVCENPICITDAHKTDKAHPPFHITVTGERMTKHSNEIIEFYCYRRGNYTRMRQRLESINFAHEFNGKGIDEAFEYFQAILNQLTVENIPRKRVKVYPNKARWWTCELQAKKNLKNKLFKRNPRGLLTDNYVQVQREFQELHDKLRTEDIKRRERNIKANPSEFWKYAKQDRRSTNYPSKMHYNNESAETPERTVNLFAKYFESSYDRDNMQTDFEGINTVAAANGRDIRVSMYDIELAINKLKPKGSVGPDQIHPSIIINCANALVFPIWLLFTKSFETGALPTKLKLSRAIPVHKKGERKDVTNYRIIAISSVILKIFEIVVQRKLTTIVGEKLSNSQHGFRQGRSVTSNLLNLSIAAHKALERRNQLDVFYGDFKCGFDRVCHRLLIQKVIKFGIGGQTVKWIYEFLYRRINYVQIGKCKSRPYEVASGVPAGSTLGPLLFLIFIDDISEVVQHAKTLLFADDIKIYLEVSSSYETLRLQSDINNLLSWCETNRLFFNESKCAVLTINRSQEFSNAIYTMKDHIIERKEEIRDLGVIVDSRLQFYSHIEHIIVGARIMMGYIKKISLETFTMATRKLLYTSYVRSKLEFASPIWDPHQQTYQDDIESIQKNFMMYLLGDNNRRPPYRLTPYEQRCKSVGLETLKQRRDISLAVLAFDVYKNSINDQNIAENLVPAARRDSRRHVRLLRDWFYGTDFAANQPLAKIVKIINKNSVQFETDSKEMFKNKIAKIICNSESNT